MKRQKRKKLKQDKWHKLHRKNVRSWRAKHPGMTYKRVGPCWQWVPKKRGP